MRINLFGPPHSGKSSIAGKLFNCLKRDGNNVEIVYEYIKEWTYIKRFPESFDQIFISANQMYREEMALRAGFEHIVTDCPLFLNCFYAQFCNFPANKQLLEIAKEYEKHYPSLNIYMPVNTENFSEVGRFHDKKEVEKIDKALTAFLQEIKLDVIVFNLLDEKIFGVAYKYIKTMIGEK